MTSVVYIGLGSNLGDKRGLINAALDRLANTPGVRLLQVSEFQATKPVGPQDQPDFLNGVACVETSLDPLTLLNYLQDIEFRLGRVRTAERWGPRTIDLDILLFGDQVIDHPRLKVPHPEIENRPFVQAALQELKTALAVL